MMVKVKIMVGAYDQKLEDCLRLITIKNDPDIYVNIYNTGVKHGSIKTSLIKEYNMADGTPHLLEYEGSVII